MEIQIYEIIPAKNQSSTWISHCLFYQHFSLMLMYFISCCEYKVIELLSKCFMCFEIATSISNKKSMKY